MSLNTYDLVRISASVVMMIVLAFQKAKHFILADGLFCLIACGISFFAPKIWNSQVSVPFDDLHMFLQHAIACMVMLPVSYYILFVRTAKDRDGLHGMLGCRTAGVGLATLAFAASHWRHPGIFNQQQFSLMLTGHLMWFGLVTYHLYKCGLALPKRPLFHTINRYIKIDIVIFSIAGLCELLLPSFLSMFLSMKIDHLHEFQLSLFGIANLANVLLGLYVLGSRQVAEKRGYLWGRIGVLVLLAVCEGYWIIMKSVALTKMDMLFFFALFPAAVVALVGLVLTSENKFFAANRSGYNLRSRN